MQKPTGKSTEFVSLDDHQPQDTGKFDCEILDGAHRSYPAQWVPPGKSTGFGQETGPGWRVLIPQQDGIRARVTFKPAHLLKNWRPQAHQRSKQGAKK